ncbi:arylsulfatase B [Strongylocentrotus purpuratus]|uniref:Sulfatase N-terminal domain-containing protein n=1 Tax=Strongylocentrotus purpuratus TaxID=7668 RepID=A0A7M7HP08_STRPU|nr:arylsulfatase B [Strongylocentrotus purpuratus]XP_791089.2 arylsulfatase B [Strongylocentrotus purpuratus]
MASIIRTRSFVLLLSSAALLIIYLAFERYFWRVAPVVSALSGGAAGVGFQPSRNPRRPPHIVFILADDYGFNDIGYRNPAMRTPNLDYLAAEGIKLDNYYVQPICTPSRAQLMSGKYQIHTGLQHSIIWPPQPNCLPLDLPTLPQKLKEAGYATHMAGKWHLGFYKKECWPTNRGFDSFLGILLGKGDHFLHTEEGGGGPYPSTWPWEGLDFRDGLQSTNAYSGIYSTHVIAERVENIIEKHDKDKPLFLYVSFQAVHTPLQVPESYLQPFESSIQDEKRRIYAGMTYCMDEAVGNITKKLKKQGLWDDTVLVFSSDNGGNIDQGASNWPLRGSKTTLWEGGVRAVGFVTSPLLSERMKGTVSRELIDISDWYPTLIEGVAGWTLSGTKLDGYNIWETLRSGKPSARVELLHNIDPLITPPSTWPNDSIAAAHNSFSTRTYAALRYKDWKIVTGYQSINNGWYSPAESSEQSVASEILPGKSVWLFNITRDPREFHDLSNQEPAIVNFLLERLESYQSGASPVLYPDIDTKANPAGHGGIWDSWE